ncbi:MAG: hypothetical protein KF782_01015 [Labilithrix sp.]|nr:hypothetical protein [Labilithrix sp.]
MTAFDIRDRLEQAAVFARNGDFTAAVARAKGAVRASRDEESRAEAALTLERLEAAERAWRASIEARAARARRASRAERVEVLA